MIGDDSDVRSCGRNGLAAEELALDRLGGKATFDSARFLGICGGSWGGGRTGNARGGDCFLKGGVSLPEAI